MVKVIVGLMGGSVANGSAKLGTAELLRPFLSMLAKHNVAELDTARVYNAGRSEELIGEVPDAIKAGGFHIATKAPGFSPGSLAYDNVMKNGNASVAALKDNKIDLYYFHGPDPKTPLEESCRAIHQLHQEGKFKRFGVSNFNKEQVLRIIQICKENGFIAPTVYQGGYNPLYRAMEEKLLPTLRENGIAFYAYSPLGGGYFSKLTEQLRAPAAGGRFEQMQVFKDMYINELTLELHEELQKACKTVGITMTAACLRWLMHHSPLSQDDGIILGGSSQEQMQENLSACESGPLPETVVTSFDNMWKRLVSERGFPAYSL